MNRHDCDQFPYTEISDAGSCIKRRPYKQFREDYFQAYQFAF